MAYVLSLVMGLIVGLIYGLVGIRSPAPPIVALAGLLGMVLGEQGVVLVKYHLSPARDTQAAPRVTSGNRHP